MINQQLLDYIKQQLQQGISKEQIKGSLVANGWQEQDIEEGFNAISSSSLTGLGKMGKIWKIIIFLVGLTVIAGGIYFITQTFFKSKRTNELSTEIIQQPLSETESSASVKETPADITTEKTAESQIIDCGTVINFQKFDCFVNAAKNCSPSKIVATTQIDLFGLISESATFYEIKGWQENKCALYMKSISGKVTYSQEFVKKLLDGGVTNEQIRQREQESSKIAQSVAGRDGICKFANADNLTILLNKWEEGDFSTDDFKNTDCRGEYFGQPEQMANTSKTITDQECANQKGYTMAVSDKGTACFNNQIDLGTIDSIKMNGKYPQCCIQK